MELVVRRAKRSVNSLCATDRTPAQSLNARTIKGATSVERSRFEKPQSIAGFAVAVSGNTTLGQQTMSCQVTRTASFLQRIAVATHAEGTESFRWANA